MDFEPSQQAKQILERVKAFMRDHIQPIELEHWREIGEARHGGDWKQWRIPPRVEALKAKARAADSSIARSPNS